MENPVVIRSHGGRARAITAGDIHIDVASSELQVLTSTVTSTVQKEKQLAVL